MFFLCVCVRSGPGSKKEKEHHSFYKTTTPHTSKNIFQLWPSALNGLAWELVFILYIYRIFIPTTTIHPPTSVSFPFSCIHLFLTQPWLLMVALTSVYRTKTECVQNQLSQRCNWVDGSCSSWILQHTHMFCKELWASTGVTNTKCFTVGLKLSMRRCSLQSAEIDGVCPWWVLTPSNTAHFYQKASLQSPAAIKPCNW